MAATGNTLKGGQAAHLGNRCLSRHRQLLSQRCLCSRYAVHSSFGTAGRPSKTQVACSLAGDSVCLRLESCGLDVLHLQILAPAGPYTGYVNWPPPPLSEVTCCGRTKRATYPEMKASRTASAVISPKGIASNHLLLLSITGGLNMIGAGGLQAPRAQCTWEKCYCWISPLVFWAAWSPWPAGTRSIPCITS